MRLVVALFSPIPKWANRMSSVFYLTSPRPDPFYTETPPQ